ncbi:MAG TPA: glycosyltransferase [Thermoplasmata archaeon]|nr:glycosyltransferase [Thermoplasmata archaeon]
MTEPAPGAAAMVAYARYPEDPRVRREAEALARHGWDVHVVALQGDVEAPREEVSGVHVVRVPFQAVRGGRLRYAYQYAVFLLLAAAGLRRLRREAGLRIVHVHSLPDFLALVAVPWKLRGVRVVLDLHEAMPELVAARFRLPMGAPLVRIAAALERLSCGVADDVVTVNEHVRGLLEARGVPRGKVTVLYNSPSWSAPSPRPVDGLVYAGGLNRERDLLTYLRALAAVPGPALTATFYGRGDDSYLEELRALAAQVRISDRVRFPGYLPPERVLGELAASAVGVVTYERNPLTEVAVPNKVFEYALVRRPLVLPDLRALRALFDGAALFYEPGDAGDLAAKIAEVLRGGPDVDVRVVRAAAIAADLSWERMEARLLVLYAKAPSRSGAGRR